MPCSLEDQLKVAIIQSDLEWENPKINRDNFSEKIDSIVNPVDLIILPEMFATGFTMQAEKVAETMDGKTVEWMQEKALKNRRSYCWKSYNI